MAQATLIYINKDGNLSTKSTRHVKKKKNQNNQNNNNQVEELMLKRHSLPQIN